MFGSIMNPPLLSVKIYQFNSMFADAKCNKNVSKMQKKKKKTIKSPVVMNLQCSFSQTVAVRNLSRCLCSRNVELLISLYLVNSKLNSVL